MEGCKETNMNKRLPIRKTTKGFVQGFYDMEIEVYYGIPYAKPPLEQLRWQPPQEMDKWKGILKADSEYPIPFQKEGYFFSEIFDEFEQSEDILYVNVWTNGNGKKKPVFVWFHGGAFQGGYAYDPVFKGISFARQDIVVVSVEYRCGVFGFLCHPDLSKESEMGISGNYGIQDQLAAMRWIKENIEYFEGDPKQITIGGQSAGGKSVHQFLHMPQAEGLFQRVIIQSGIISESNSMKLEDSEKFGVCLMEKLNCSSIEELRRIDGKTLLNASFDLQKSPLCQGVFPYIDNVYIFEEEEICYERRIPLLIGNNSHEGIMFFQSMDRKGYLEFLKTNYGQKAERILERYPVESDEEALSQIIRVESDAWCAAMEQYVEKRIKAGCAPTYVYYFAHRSTDNDGGVLEANHSGELWYMFDSLEHAIWKVGEEDKKLAYIMNQYWAGFIKKGMPYAEGQPDWLPFEEGNPVRMKFTDCAREERAPVDRGKRQILIKEEKKYVM